MTHLAVAAAAAGSDTTLQTRTVAVANIDAEGVRDTDPEPVDRELPALKRELRGLPKG